MIGKRRIAGRIQGITVEIGSDTTKFQFVKINKKYKFTGFGDMDTTGYAVVKERQL